MIGENMANGLKINEDEFEMLESAKQNRILFKNTEEILSLLKCQVEACNTRFGKLESRKRKDTAFAGGSGLLGGFLAMIANSIFK